MIAYVFGYLDLNCDRGWQIEFQLWLTAKSLQQAFNPKLLGSLHQHLNFKTPQVNHNNIMDMDRICLCPSNIGHVLGLPGAVSPGVVHNASLKTTLSVRKC